MKQICAHADTMGEAVTALESDENGDFFRYVVSERTRKHEQRFADNRPIVTGGWRAVARDHGKFVAASIDPYRICKSFF